MYFPRLHTSPHISWLLQRHYMSHIHSSQSPSQRKLLRLSLLCQSTFPSRDTERMWSGAGTAFCAVEEKPGPFKARGRNAQKHNSTKATRVRASKATRIKSTPQCHLYKNTPQCHPHKEHNTDVPLSFETHPGFGHISVLGKLKQYIFIQSLSYRWDE